MEEFREGEVLDLCVGNVRHRRMELYLGGVLAGNGESDGRVTTLRQLFGLTRPEDEDKKYAGSAFTEEKELEGKEMLP